MRILVNLHNWSLGSFSGINWDNVKVMAIVVLITMFFVFLLSKPISAYQMGEAYAQNMGLNVSHFRIVLVILSSILSACVTAFAGPVSFVGIAVPHLVKGLFGTTQPILMIPACFLGGASFCLFCRFAGKNSIYSHRVVDQHGNCNFGRSGGYLHYATPEKRKDGVIGNESWLSIYKRFNCWL